MSEKSAGLTCAWTAAAKPRTEAAKRKIVLRVVITLLKKKPLPEYTFDLRGSVKSVAPIGSPATVWRPIANAPQESLGRRTAPAYNSTAGLPKENLPAPGRTVCGLSRE